VIQGATPIYLERFPKDFRGAADNELSRRFYEQEVVKAFRELGHKSSVSSFCASVQKRVIGSRAGQSLAPADP
jgi:hypothetical protein